MYQLSLNKRHFTRNVSTLGLNFLLKALGGNPSFNLSLHEDSVNAMRGMHGSVIYFEDKRIYLDMWEYPTPSHTEAIFKQNFDLIIKVQHRDISSEAYNQFCDRKNMMQITKLEREAFLNKFVPWTFFPSRIMEGYLGREGELKAKNDTHIGF